MPFTQSELSQHIIELLNVKSVVPEGHKGALVIHNDLTQVGVSVALATKIGDHWEIQNEIQWHPHEGGLQEGFNVVGTW